MPTRIQNAARMAADLGVTPAQLVGIMNSFDAGNPAGLNGAMGFNINVFEQVTSRAYDVKLPDILWSKTIDPSSIDTSVNPGAKLVSYRVRDRRGKGAFAAVVGKDTPTVGVTMNKVTVPVEIGRIMAQADLDDIRAVAFGFEGMNLLTDKGVAMREAAERHIEEVFFFGYADLGFAGYIDYDLVPASSALTKAATGTEWADATGDEIVADVNYAQGLIYQNSKGLFMGGRLELPLAQLVQISSQRMGGASGPTGENVTVLDYLKRNNLYTQTTGRELEVRGLRYLEGAGAGETDRFILSDPNPEYSYMPMSIPFQMLPPQDVQFATNLFAEYKFGSFHKPYPTSAHFIDGI